MLRDSTVISGDDRGQVQIWDGEVGALISNFQQHAAEVLAIAVDANERDVFATGVDSKVSCFRRRLLDGVSISEAGPADYSWHYTTSHRPHSHDVNALCVCPSTNLLLSGGVDSKICTYSLSDFSSCRPAWVLPIPAVGLVSSSVDHSLVGIRSGSMVDLWTMTLELSQDLNSQNKVIPRNHCEFSLRLQLKGVDHVHCHSVSPDGLFLAVSRADSGTRVWALSRTNGAIAPTLLTLPTKIATATCSSLEFSRDGRRLVALSCDGRVYILKFNSESGKTKAATKSRGNKSSLANVSESPLLEALIAVELDLRGVLSDGQSIYHRIPRRITVSTDERYLAVSDCASGVYVYDIDSMRLHWRLPQRDRAVTGIRFGPSSASGALVVSYSDNTFQLFDADNCKLADWSQHNPPSKFPALLVDRPGVCEDIVFHPQHPWILFRGKGFAVFTNTSCDLPTDPKVVSYSADASEKKRITSQADINVGRKRKHLATQDTLMSERNGLVIVERYRSMTHAAFSEHGEHTQLVRFYCMLIVVMYACTYLLFIYIPPEPIRTRLPCSRFP